MKNLLLTCIVLLIAIVSNAQVNSNNHYVEGYYKSNGTYVEGHYRTNPNSTVNDNYSTFPNVNPYTGEQGTVKPDYSTPNYTSPTITTPTITTPTFTTPTYTTPNYTTPSYTSPTYQSPSIFDPN